MIIIHTPKLYNDKVEYPVTLNGSNKLFFIKCKNWPVPLNPCIDGLVLNLCHMAICNNLEIVSKEPIDELLYQNLMKLPEVYKQHHSARKYLTGKTPVNKIALQLTLPTCKRAPNNSGIVITPLSMGLDSLNHIATYKDDFTHLLYIKNMDPGNIPKEVETNMLFISKYINKPLITIESNFRNILIGSKLIASGIMNTGDSIIFSNAYPLCPDKIMFNGAGIDMPNLYTQHPDLNRHYFSNQLVTTHHDIMRCKKVKNLLYNEPMYLNLVRVCCKSYTPTFTMKHKQNGLEYISGNFNCRNCRKCSLFFAYIYMLDKTYPLLNNINYLEKYMKEFHDYKKIPGYATDAKYYKRDFDAIHSLYIKQGHLNNLDEHTF